MKELTTEQKAQRYDEALERASKLRVQNPFDTVSQMMEHIFPELAESKDERIRKALINGFNKLDKSAVWYNGITNYQILAWLEKQGKRDARYKYLEELLEADTIYQMAMNDAMVEEAKAKAIEAISNMDIFELLGLEKQGGEQKPDDKAKAEHLIPQKGMYYTCIKDYYSSDNTHLCVKGNVYKSPFKGYIDDESHFGLSWTNSCAEEYFEPTKDENWIVCEHDNVIGKPMQYKEFKKKVNQKFVENLKAKGITPKLRLWNLKDAKEGDILVCIGKYGQEIGIIKEYVGKYGGCDKCFETYCFVDWEGIFRTGEYIGSKEIHPATKEQQNQLEKAMADAGYTFDFEKKELKKIKQKPNEWSEEDEQVMSTIMKEGDLKPSERIWLKSLKDRVQPKQEWKQENTGDLTDFENTMMHIGNSFFGKNAGLDPNDTNAIKEQANLLLELVPNKEWSEEDEHWRQKAIDFMKHPALIKATPTLAKDTITWLKSLRPQSRWKPSGEQMKALDIAIRCGIQLGTWEEKALKDLIEQLKKLKG